MNFHFQDKYRRMKKYYILIACVLFVRVCFCNSIHPKPPKTPKGVMKYGISFPKTNHSQKHEFRKWLYNEEAYVLYPKTDDRFGRFRGVNMYHRKLKNGESKMPDSIVADFSVEKITVKNDNYVIGKRFMQKRTIFLIDILPVEADVRYPSHIRLISIEEKGEKTKNINEGDTLRLDIQPFFDRDLYEPDESGHTVIFQAHESRYSLVYENLWVVLINFQGYNWFWSPDIKGLCYVGNSH